MITYIITIYTPSNEDSNGEVEWIHRLENISEDFFKGFYNCLLNYYAEENLIVEKLW